MSLTAKALFVIERNLESDLALDGIAKACGVLRFHLSHAFGRTAGVSVMDCLRARRLTRAARALAGGAPDILTLALESGYASHEAFTRAFKARFGVTPEAVRETASLGGLTLVDPLPHPETHAMILKEPRIETAGELKFVGLSAHVPYDGVQAIPAQWRRFMGELYDGIGERIAGPPTSLIVGADDKGMDYVCAAEVSRFGQAPPDCIKVTVPPATYAVFAHDANVTGLNATYEAIWNDWFPNSGRLPVQAPSLERHNPTFDPRTGEGGVTLWIPITA